MPDLLQETSLNKALISYILISISIYSISSSISSSEMSPLLSLSITKNYLRKCSICGSELSSIVFTNILRAAFLNIGLLLLQNDFNLSRTYLSSGSDKSLERFPLIKECWRAFEAFGLL